MTHMLRCAIYTRKSTDEGLDQAFNSLDAQREACEAYIKSQKHEGWKLLPQKYDDGGYSGGNMDRPALALLLEEIRAKRVDIVVVYKVDRLTRALSDFARMVELFDSHGVSFVSITQQFNTTTSMGRLTLNVLLSFAQFEREVTAERIRDKIAASRKKGMWMGGSVPLGYDVRDKKLVINEDEAKTVRGLFNRYLELGSVRQLMDAIDRSKIVTKVHRPIGKPTTGGKPFTRGGLYYLLTNPIYAGNVRHKNAVHSGEHESIIEPTIWLAVQDMLAKNASNRRSSANVKSPHLLTGLVFDETGDRLSPSHASKKGRRYNYYVSKRLTEKSRENEDGWRLPAHELETITIDAIKVFIGDQKWLSDALKLRGLSAHDQTDIRGKAENLAAELDAAPDGDRKSVLAVMIKSITLGSGSLTIQMFRSALMSVLRGKPTITAESDQTIAIKVPITIGRRGMETKLVIAGANPTRSSVDPNLVELVAQAHCWFALLTSGECQTVREVAEKGQADETDVSRILQLAFLAPAVVQSIAQGRHQGNLTSTRLKRLTKISFDWKAQQAEFCND